MASDRRFVPPSSAFDAVAKSEATDEPDRGRGDFTGLLIIRASVEEGSREPLRVQIRHTTNVSKGFQRTLNVTDVQAASAAVEGWLRGLTAEPTSPE